MKIKSNLLALALTAASIATVNAATIAAWNTTGLSGVTSGALAATTLDANVGSASLDRGAGITASSLSNGYASSGWADSKANAISGDDFLLVSFSAPTVGYTLSFESIQLNFRNTSTGVRAMQWQYSLDGFSTAGIDVGSEFTLPGATTVADYGPVDLSGVTALQGITTGVSFRLLGWNDTGNLGSGGTGAVGTSSGDNLVFTGTVVPEPTTALLGGLGMLVLLRRRRF